jgi:hypothetical protein
MSKSRKSRVTRRIAATALPLALAAAALPAGASAATAFYGVTSNDQLITLQSDNARQAPGKPLQGLAVNEHVESIASRPATGQLFGLTNVGRIVAINPLTAQLTTDAQVTPALTGGHFALAVNPTLDRFQVTTDSGQNIVVTPSDDQAALNAATKAATAAYAAAGVTPTTPPATPDQAHSLTKPAYVAGDASAPNAPVLADLAFTNAFPTAGTSTQLYALDAARNTLATFNSISGGQVKTVGTLGTTGTPETLGIASGNVGYAIVNTGTGATAASSLYKVDLSTGKASKTTAGSNQLPSSALLVGLAVAGDVAADKTPPKLSVSSSSTQLKSRLTGVGVQLTANCNEACDGTASVSYGSHTVGSKTFSVATQAGYARVTIPLSSATKSSLNASGSHLIHLKVKVADGAGNTSILTRPIRTR